MAVSVCFKHRSDCPASSSALMSWLSKTVPGPEPFHSHSLIFMKLWGPTVKSSTMTFDHLATNAIFEPNGYWGSFIKLCAVKSAIFFYAHLIESTTEMWYIKLKQTFPLCICFDGEMYDFLAWWLCYVCKWFVVSTKLCEMGLWGIHSWLKVYILHIVFTITKVQKV